jgi:HrpA-like RNA helicase
MIITTKSSKETKDLGKMLAQEIKNGPASTRGNAMSTRGGQVICLSGELGSGKTTFTQGFLQGLKVKGPYTSPTFVIMKKYESKVKSLPEMLRPPATMLQLRAGISKQAGQKSKVKNIDADLSLLTHEKELSLIKELNKFPELVEEIAKSYMAHKLPHYAIKLADKFHSFYNACKVLDEDNMGMTKARLEVVKSAKIVLGETLKLIGVDSPEKM